MFMTVTVRTMMGEEWEFLVSQTTSVIDLKMAIFTRLIRMHPDTQVRQSKHSRVSSEYLLINVNRCCSTRVRRWRRTRRPWLSTAFR